MYSEKAIDKRKIKKKNTDEKMEIPYIKHQSNYIIKGLGK